MQIKSHPQYKNTTVEQTQALAQFNSVQDLMLSRDWMYSPEAKVWLYFWLDSGMLWWTVRGFHHKQYPQAMQGHNRDIFALL